MKNNDWRSAKILPRNTSEDRPVDIWMHITPSPLSMGMGDSWRVVDCWVQDGKWVHRHKGEVAELNADYITHWMRQPKSPRFQKRSHKPKEQE